jgi:prepilin-type N-terminal cleavage/methylation domain-containing protein
MKTRACRPGYSLLELVLVLAVMLIVTALALPSLKGMYGSYKLNGAVDSVRAAWAQARARAIAENRPYRFGVIPETGQYRVAPDLPDYWTGSGRPSSDLTNGEGAVLEESLPPGVRFSMSGGGAPSADVGDSSLDPAGRGSKSSASADAYTSAAVFRPDGTARADCEILFQVRGARPTALCLRGMTGVITVKSNPGSGGAP